MRVTRSARRVSASTSQLFPENLPSADSAANTERTLRLPTTSPVQVASSVVILLFSSGGDDHHRLA